MKSTDIVKLITIAIITLVFATPLFGEVRSNSALTETLKNVESILSEDIGDNYDMNQFSNKQYKLYDFVNSINKIVNNLIVNYKYKEASDVVSKLIKIINVNSNVKSRLFYQRMDNLSDWCNDKLSLINKIEATGNTIVKKIYNGIETEQSLIILEIKATNGRDEFIDNGTVYIDGNFSGYTPGKFPLNNTAKELKIEYGFWGYENAYIMKLENGETNIPSIVMAEYNTSSDCLVRNATDFNELKTWKKNFKIQSSVQNKLVVSIPGLIRVERVNCQFSPWFGEIRYYKLRITSEPIEADVIIEGRNYGKSPTSIVFENKFARNRMNKLRIFLKKEGYLGVATEYSSANDSENAELHFKLTKERVD